MRAVRLIGRFAVVFPTSAKPQHLRDRRNRAPKWLVSAREPENHGARNQSSAEIYFRTGAARRLPNRGAVQLLAERSLECNQLTGTGARPMRVRLPSLGRSSTLPMGLPAIRTGRSHPSATLRKAIFRPGKLPGSTSAARGKRALEEEG